MCMCFQGISEKPLLSEDRKATVDDFKILEEFLRKTGRFENLPYDGYGYYTEVSQTSGVLIHSKKTREIMRYVQIDTNNYQDQQIKKIVERMIHRVALSPLPKKDYLSKIKVPDDELENEYLKNLYE